MSTCTPTARELLNEVFLRCALEAFAAEDSDRARTHDAVHGSVKVESSLREHGKSVQVDIRLTLG